MSSQRVVMLIDDDDKNLSMIGWNLEKAFPGVEVRKFNNGLDALSFLPRLRDRLALVILDLTMPVLDGIAVAAEIRATVTVPIIPITGDSTRQSHDVSADIGCLPTILRGVSGITEVLVMARQALEHDDVPPIGNPGMVAVLRDQVRAARTAMNQIAGNASHVAVPLDTLRVLSDIAISAAGKPGQQRREVRRAAETLQRILTKN